MTPNRSTPNVTPLLRNSAPEANHRTQTRATAAKPTRNRASCARNRSPRSAERPLVRRRSHEIRGRAPTCYTTCLQSSPGPRSAVRPLVLAPKARDPRASPDLLHDVPTNEPGANRAEMALNGPTPKGDATPTQPRPRGQPPRPKPRNRSQTHPKPRILRPKPAIPNR